LAGFEVQNKTCFSRMANIACCQSQHNGIASARVQTESGDHFQFLHLAVL
jgi:hypothetical protein